MALRRVRPEDGPEPKIRLVFRENIRNRRIELGMTQRALAARLPVDHRWIQQLEAPRHKGKFKEPSLQMIERMAIELNTTPHELLTPGRFAGIVSGDTDLRRTRALVH